MELYGLKGAFMLKKVERLKIIQESLKSQHIITVKELSKILGISEMTARRDVESLSEQGIVDSFYGGVSLSKKKLEHEKAITYNIEKEIVERKNQKMRIAKKAASLIDSNDVLLIDAGSTTSAIIDFIPNDSKNIVYCFALNILQSACEKENLSVISCGGLYHKNTQMFTSDEGVELLKRARFNKVFIATRGLTKEIGITTAESYEIEMKQAAMGASKQKILLLDSSKMGKAWNAKFAEIEDFDIVITDSEVEEKYVKMIEELGVTIYVV